MVFGLTFDFLGYILPRFNFVLDEQKPYFEDAPGDPTKRPTRSARAPSRKSSARCASWSWQNKAGRASMARYVLAIDQGTTGSTVLLVDESLQVRARGYAEFPQIYPSPAGSSTIQKRSGSRSSRPWSAR